MKQATKRPIIRRTEEEKLGLIESWEKSGLSIKRFCEERRFSDSLFHAWLNKYRRHRQKLTPPVQDFLPLQITAPSSAITGNPPAPYAEVVLTNAVRITFYQPVAMNDLRTLIA